MVLSKVWQAVWGKKMEAFLAVLSLSLLCHAMAGVGAGDSFHLPDTRWILGARDTGDELRSAQGGKPTRRKQNRKSLDKVRSVEALGPRRELLITQRKAAGW